MKKLESLEERLAWRWLRQQLTAELGVNFRTGGRPRAVDAVTERMVLVKLAVTPRNRRMEAYRALAAALSVSPVTIQRMALRQYRQGLAVL